MYTVAEENTVLNIGDILILNCVPNTDFVMMCLLYVISSDAKECLPERDFYEQQLSIILNSERLEGNTLSCLLFVSQL